MRFFGSWFPDINGKIEAKSWAVAARSSVQTAQKARNQLQPDPENGAAMASQSPVAHANGPQGILTCSG